MLRDKDIIKIQEIKTLFKSNWIRQDNLRTLLTLFKINSLSNIFKTIKKSGVCVWDIFHILILITFSTSKTINGIQKDKFAPKSEGKKDVYYRLLSNQKMNWRSILFLFIKRYLELESKFTPAKNQIKCLVFDDTDIEKTGKKIEGVSKIYNHVTNRYIFGYKLLVAGYWNGSVFIPIDFSFHRENKDNKVKKYGLTKKEYSVQKKTQRAKGSAVLKRFKELNKSKTEVVVEMFKRIKQRKIAVDYILMDTWFTSISLINKLKEVNSNIDIIGMYKYNSQVELKCSVQSIRQLRKSKKTLKRSRKTRHYYQQYRGKINGQRVKIFLIRKGKKGKWHTILTTDTNLSFTKMMEIYSTRWSIEVFFKESKQLLGLGKSQSTNFDVQVAQTTITMIQYLLISLKYRAEAYETKWSIFKELKENYIEHKLNERIMFVINEIMDFLATSRIKFDYEVMISKLIDCIGNKELNGTTSLREIA